jgi:hypothetical protein
MLLNSTAAQSICATSQEAGKSLGGNREGIYIPFEPVRLRFEPASICY